MKKLFLILSIYTSIIIAADDITELQKESQQLDLTHISVIVCTEIMPLKAIKSDTTNMI